MEQIPTVKEVDTQFAKSMTSDFEEGTWTFLMPEKFQVWAGYFAIVDKQVYDKMIQRLALCEGKEKEIAELKTELEDIKIVYSKLVKSASAQRISELEAENERLKGLIEKMFINEWRDSNRYSPNPLSEVLQQFKTENNL